MRKHFILYIALFALSALVSCNKDFLERYPQSEISPQVFFQNAQDLELYTNSFYAYLPGVDIVMEDFSSDNVDVSGIDERVAGTRRVLTEASAAGWTWSPLYNINYFLQQYNNPEIPQSARNHFSGIARFFRAFFYFEKVKRFGDVPWYSVPLNVNSPELYKARDSRVTVVDSILADLDYAIENLRDEKTVGKINKWAALALQSRVALFEGTFRKYHTELNLQESAEALLEKAAQASETLMTEGPYALSQGDPETVYLNLFSAQTPNTDEFILARLYSMEVNKAHPLNQIFTSPTRGNPGLTKSLINSYLCRDGSPFSSLPDYDKIPFWEETKNRDPRLAQTIRTPGYTRIGSPESDPALVPDYANAFTGYQNIKFVSTPDQDAASYTPLPVFRLAEVLLNYAEAKAELSQFSQPQADRSVNLIRRRVGMPPLVVNELQGDPMLLDRYTHTTDPLILEIRRERRVELAMEGFRYYDLMRWKEGQLLADTFYGAYYPFKGYFDLDQDGNDDIAVLDTQPSDTRPGVQYFILQPDKALSQGESGRIVVHPNLDKTFVENRDYLYPLPLNELLLNDKLTQNPNWK